MKDLALSVWNSPKEDFVASSSAVLQGVATAYVFYVIGSIVGVILLHFLFNWLISREFKNEWKF